jgi:anti-sigma regulatory factor (Ser/Thr protein kinase)
MGVVQLTPEMRITVSLEEISRYVAEIRDLLQELSERADVDNDQLAKIATAVSEIGHVVPAMLQR